MITFLQADYSADDNAAAALGAVFGLGMFLFILGFALFICFCLYKIFKKANHPNAWGAFIPFYSAFVRIDVIKRPWWQFFLYLIPFYGLYLAIVDTNRLSKFFGKDEGFTVGLIFLPIIFYPILAFGDAKYNPNALPDERLK